ncbi:Yae1 family protein [Aspergillus undulatus]|uniref:Yae1 family protein n=1 Tax=Aspergillus undulatus TaxID=1810928 RepID=UPI003CCCD85E
MSAPDSSLDDIFGSSPPHSQSATTLEPSDLPLLRREHVTAGYRDGISASKADHVQHGFDTGFPVGAQLGMRAGTILGILEGVLRGYESSSSAAGVRKPGQKPSTTTVDKELDEAKRAKRDKILAIYCQACKELNVQAVFADVNGDQLQDKTKEEKPETQLAKKGDAVLGGWERKVEVAAWEGIMDALETKSDHGKADSENKDKEGVVNGGTAGQS